MNFDFEKQILVAFPVLSIYTASDDHISVMAMALRSLTFITRSLKDNYVYIVRAINCNIHHSKGTSCHVSMANNYTSKG